MNRSSSQNTQPLTPSQQFNKNTPSISKPPSQILHSQKSDDRPDHKSPKKQTERQPNRSQLDTDQPVIPISLKCLLDLSFTPDTVLIDQVVLGSGPVVYRYLLILVSYYRSCDLQ
jgi:hypothetical protein